MSAGAGKLEVRDVKPHIGSIIEVDRQVLFDDEELIPRCRQLLDERGVLVFPRLHLSDAEQLELTDRMGTRINLAPKDGVGIPGSNFSAQDVYTVTLDPEINDQPEYVHGTFFWHMDGMTVDVPPPKATLLSCRKTSAKGGQTEFASTFAGYEMLPDEDKEEIEGLRAVHSLFSSMRNITDAPTEEERARWGRVPVRDHPIVWKRRSGRRSLVIGNTTDRVLDMPLHEGRALLVRLLEWTAQPDFSYRHTWQEGDLVIWDNCGVLHRALPYDQGSGRRMHRTSLEGDEAIV